jgi:hypothetical protein
MPDKARDDRVSLAPLDPEEALRALLAVDPNDDLVPEQDPESAEREI